MKKEVQNSIMFLAGVLYGNLWWLVFVLGVRWTPITIPLLLVSSIFVVIGMGYFIFHAFAEEKR